MQWAIWDETINGPSSIMRNLPENLQGKAIDEINALGYYELVSVQPEDYIPRFAELSGSAVFEFRDNYVYQTYPEADFSLNAVRGALKLMAANEASRRLAGSDWYVLRSFELGTEVPEDVRKLRGMIRDHLDWIRNDVETKGPRELVEYRWDFPRHPDEVMVNGSPVLYTGVGNQPKNLDLPGLSALEDPTPGILRQNMEGIPLAPGLDANDIPVVEDPMPHLSDPAPFIENPIPALTDKAPKVPDGDIRTMNQEQRDQLQAANPEEFDRLMQQELERSLREGDAWRTNG